MPPAPPEHHERRAPQARPTCEYCQCKLTAHGEVLEFSDKAKRFRRIDQEIDELKVKLAAAEATVTELRAKLTEASTVRESRGIHL